MNRNVLVTGGAGFIGTHLCRHLLSAGGYNVTVLDNESSGDRASLRGLDVRFLPGDVRSVDDVSRAVEGQEVVVHLAADTRVMDSIQDPALNFDVNVDGSFRLLEACRSGGVVRLVAASTGGAIVGDVEPPVHEEMAPCPVSPYGASKLMLEGYLSAYTASFGLSACALRFSNIYGPGSLHKGSVVAHFCKQLLAGRPLTVYGDGSQSRDFLYAGDLVAGIRAAMEDLDAVGAYQFGSGRPTSLNELIAVLRAVSGRSICVNYEDFRPGEVRNTWCQTTKAQQQFGFTSPTSLADGLRQTWNWFRAQAGGPA